MKNLILIFNSIFIFEKKALKKKLTLIEYFFKNINLINYYFFLFNKNKHNPIKSHKFQKYIELNKNKWAKEKINKLYSKNSILVEAFINHPAYILSNIVTSMYLNAIFKMNIVGLIRTHDLKSEVLFRSFGVRNFIYFKNPNIYERIYYLIKDKFTQRTDYTVTYDHISRKLNMDYEIISGLIPYDFNRTFKIFANELDDLIRREAGNDCGRLNDDDKVSQIMTIEAAGQISIQIIHRNRPLILKCSKFIDSRVIDFNRRSLGVTKQILSNKGYEISASSINSQDKSKELDLMNLITDKFFNIDNLDQIEMSDAISLYFVQSFIKDNKMSNQVQSQIYSITGNIDEMQFVTKNLEIINSIEASPTMLFMSLLMSIFILLVVIVYGRDEQYTRKLTKLLDKFN